VVSGLGGRVLDLCCGVGWHDRADAVGIDLDWVLLARFPGHRVLGDSLDPPLVGGSFDNVLLLGAVDSVRDPWLLLAQADALLAPGGRLLVATPFAWLDEVTPPQKQLDEALLVGFFERRDYRLHRAERAWPLRRDARNHAVHRCLVLEATKPA
jgi:SAM-dependent methyltransferase